MMDFKAKMHQIRFRLGLCPGPHWGSLQCSPDTRGGFKWAALRQGEGLGWEGEGKGGPPSYCWTRAPQSLATPLIATAGESDKMRINHVIKTDQWQSALQIRRTPHFVVSPDYDHISVWYVRVHFPSALWHCWRQEGHLTCKKWMLDCWWWWFDWSFARLIAPVVTTTFIILSCYETG